MLYGKVILLCGTANMIKVGGIKVLSFLETCVISLLWSFCSWPQ